MSLIGKITTFFEDKEMTTPVFPRTKTNAVTDEEGNTLDTLLEELKSSGSGVPTPSTSDNGKFLQVVDGVAAWVAVEDAEGVEV